MSFLWASAVVLYSTAPVGIGTGTFFGILDLRPEDATQSLERHGWPPVSKNYEFE